jgi:hypothetical protein
MRNQAEMLSWKTSFERWRNKKGKNDFGHSFYHAVYAAFCRSSKTYRRDCIGRHLDFYFDRHFM